MVRPGGLCRVVCALVVLLAVHCDAQKGKVANKGKVGSGGTMGKAPQGKAAMAGKVASTGKVARTGKVGKVASTGKVAAKFKAVGSAPPVSDKIQTSMKPQPLPVSSKPAPNCVVHVRHGQSGHVDTLVDDGLTTIEVMGQHCSFEGRTPSGGALVCFLYAALVIMPVLYCLSVEKNTSDYTWAFLHNFMGIFIAILWWSCVSDYFHEALEFHQKLGVLVLIRCLVVPGVFWLIADKECLFSVAAILTHLVAFMGVDLGMEALKWGAVVEGAEEGRPGIKLFGICILFVVLNLALWKIKNILLEHFLKEGIDPIKEDRVDEVYTEMNLDCTALNLACMIFLSAHMLYFNKSELLRDDADRSMSNSKLFDQKSEGEFAALYSLGMFAITIAMEHFGGNEHEHPSGEAEVEQGKIALCQEKGTINGEKTEMWRRVLVVKKGDGRAFVKFVNESVFDGAEVEAKNVKEIELHPAEEETMDDYLWHLLQLAMMASASWSGLLALNYLVRKQWFPYLLEKELEGALFVSVILLFISGFFIASLSAHAAGGPQSKILSNKIMRYMRVYFLRAISLAAALSWDMTFDAAVEDLPVGAFGKLFRSEIPDWVCGLFVASIMTLFLAPIYVVKMHPSIVKAIASLEHKEKVELGEEDGDEHAKTD